MAQALDVPVSDLLEAPAEPAGRLVRATGRMLLPSPAEGLRLELLAPSIDNTRTFALGTFEPGVTAQQRNINPGSESFVYVIEGSARMDLASDEPLVLEAGDSVSFPSDDFKAMANTSDGQTVFLWVQAARQP